jgi:hypothetical protein
MRRLYRITLITLIVLVATTGFALAASANFRAHLSGEEEVPTRETLAQGQVTLQLSNDGESMRFKLIASNIENVVGAHIHWAPPGVNGPIVVGLFSSPAGAGRQDGVLAEGVITAVNLTGPLAGQPLSALVDLIEAGNAYVNVHTNDGIDPSNTGPGDFQTGEIRGQLFGQSR